MKRFVGVAALFSATAIVVACSSNKPNPPMTPSSTTDGGADGGMLMPMPMDAGAAAPTASATAPSFFTDAGASPTGPAAMTDQAMDVALDALIGAVSAKDAPKMAEEGAPGHQTLKEGDHFGMMVTMQPGRCYTMIATALPGTITQLDLHLYGPPLYNVEAGRSGATDKALPVIGKGTQAMCPILPLAIPYKIDAVATKGAGRIAIKVYSRAK